MIYAGVDIAKMDHVIGAVDETGAEVARPMPFKNSEAGFERCVAWLESVAESEDGVFVGMEATGHYWMACFAYLTAAGYRVCVVNPMQVRAMRSLKGMPGVKNDRVDAWLIAETLRQGDYDETRLATDEVQALKQLTRYHQGLKQELATVKTQAICVLDAYFPEYAGLFSDMFGSASLKVLAECPTPSEVERRRAATIAKLLSEGSRGRFGEAKAAQVKAAAKSSVGIRLGEDGASVQLEPVGSGVGVGVVTGAALDTVAGGVGAAEAEAFLPAFRLTVMSTMTAATTAMSKIPPKSICHFVLTAACSAAGVPAFSLDVRSGIRSADLLRPVPQYGQRLRRPEYSRPQRRQVILGMTLIGSLQYVKI